MFWTWDSYRGEADTWARDAGQGRRDEHPLSDFFWRLDLMLYAAAAAFAACVIALLLG